MFRPKNFVVCPRRLNSSPLFRLFTGDDSLGRLLWGCRKKSIKRQIFYIIKFVLTFQNIIILLGSTSLGKCIFAFLFVVWCWDLTEGILEHMGGGWLLLFMILTLMPYQYWYWGPDKKKYSFHVILYDTYAISILILRSW